MMAVVLVEWIGSRSVLGLLRPRQPGSTGVAFITTFVTTPVPTLREAIVALATTHHVYILASPIAVATDWRRGFYLGLEASLGDSPRAFNVKVLKFPLLHAKTVLLRSEADASLLVGSSNLTRGGLEMNEEANLHVSGSPTEPIFVEHEAWFHSLWSKAMPLREYVSEVPAVPEELFLDAVAQYDASDLAIGTAESGVPPVVGVGARMGGAPGEQDDRAASAPRRLLSTVWRNVVGGSSESVAHQSTRQRPNPRRDNFLDLYAYQQRALELAIGELRRGASPCIALPTGAGKTEVAIQLIWRYFLQPEFRIEFKQKRLLVVTPKRELCEQFYELLRERMPSAAPAQVVLYQDGAVCFDEVAPDTERPLVLVATDQSTGRLNSPLRDRLGEAGFGPHRFDAFILDEAHHRPSDMYHYTVEELGRGAKPCVGLTATPFRLDREPLGFDRYIVARLPSLIEAGFLAQPNYVPVQTRTRYRIAKDDLTGSKRDGGKDLSARKLAAIGRDERRTAVIADEIIAQKVKRGWVRTIVFCASVDEARNVSDRLQRTLRTQGVGCVVSSPGDDYDDDLGRDDAVEAFRLGELEILVNCQIFIEGFDVPDADSIVIARPTMSVNYYKQMMGRGCRISIAAQKTKFDLLDFLDDADLDDVGDLVHGHSLYGLFEKGYSFLDGEEEGVEDDVRIVYCDGSHDNGAHLLHRPFSQILTELDPGLRAVPGSPFHRARRTP